MKKPLCLTLVLSLLSACVLPSSQLLAYTVQTGDQLWSEFVANPHNHSHIPDGSYAGYMRGEAPIPDYPVVANLLDFGGVGDGVTDNTEAFREALRSAGAQGGGAVLVPAGTYAVEDIILLKQSGVVLRGEGMGQTIIKFQNPLENALGSTGYGTSKWNWAGGLLWIHPGTNVPELGGQATFSQNTPSGISNGGPGHAWEYWFQGATLASVTGTFERGTFTLEVDDASKIQPGSTYLVTYDVSRQLYEEIGDHPLMVGQDYGSWLNDQDSYPFWHWPVEVAQVNGNLVTLFQPLRVAARPEYNVQFRELGPAVRHSGIEDMTIQGEARLTMGNNSSLGWNAVGFNKTLHCWARNIEVVNMENGFMVSSAKNVSIVGTRINGDRMMHHPYTCRPTTHDTLYHDFEVNLTGGALGGMHGLNTEWLSTGNVWSHGTMNQGTFDSHRAISFDFIRTDISLKSNKESNPGGASQAGRFTGRRVVHWNINIDNSNRPDENGLDARGLYIYQHDQFVRSALVGVRGAPMCDLEPYAMPSGDKDVIVGDEGLVPTEPNLYLAQLDARKDREAWVLPENKYLDAPLAPGDIAFPVSINLPQPLTASRVALEVDGAIVAEDTSAPFSPLWIAAAEGEYSIRFLLEDNLGGQIFSPAYAITVGQRIIVEDNDLNLVSNNTQFFSAPYFSEGRVRHNMDYLEYTFVGTRIRVIGGSTSGQMKGDAFVDDFGTPVSSFSIRSSFKESDKIIFDSGLLPAGVHHLRLERTSENLVVDYILVDSTGDPASTPLPPKARFSLTPDSGNAPLEISLNASASSDPDGSLVSYEWDFNNDGIIDASGVSVSHTYAAWENHLVTLKVTDDSGLSTVSTRTVVVTEPMPIAVIAASATSGNIPLSTSFDATSSLPSETFRSITLYEWDFNNDGVFDATGITTNHLFTSSGNFTVRLRVTDDFGRTGETTVTISALNQAPVIDLDNSLSFQRSAAPYTVNLAPVVTDDGVPGLQELSNQWTILSQPDGADGQFDNSNLQSPSFTMDQFGTYELQLEVFDGDLTSTRTLLVSLVPDSSGGYVSVGGEVVMEAERYNRRLAGEGGINWEAQNSETGFSGSGYVQVPNGSISSEADPLPVLQYEVNFQQTGNYWIWIRRNVPDYGANSAFTSINGLNPSQIDNNNSDPNVWLWKRGASTLSISEIGIKTFQLIMREDGYRVDKIILTTSSATPTGEGPFETTRDGNEPPTAWISASALSGEVPFTVSFDGSFSTDDKGVVSYEWDIFQDGLIESTNPQVTHTFTEAGTYSVSLAVVDTEGKSHQTAIQVDAYQYTLGLPPVPFATVSPLSGQAPLTIQLDASGSFDPDDTIVSYNWDINGDGFTDVSGYQASYSIVEGGSFTPTLTVKDSTGLSASISAGTVTTTAPAISFGDDAQYAIESASFLGSGGDEQITGMAYQSSGALIIAANIGANDPVGSTALLLNGATATSSGAILRLTPDGKQILSIARIADRVEDISLDAKDTIYVAAANDGVIALNALADTLLWSHPLNGYGMRIDAAQDGRTVALNITSQNDEGSIFIFDVEGSLLNSFLGRNYSQDVAIDETRDQIFLSGYRQDHSGCNPVQVAYLHAQDFEGGRVWSNYGWPGTQLDDCDGDGYTNNMADTRGYRVDVGQDGLLYAAFESAGGNHIFRFEPKVLNLPVPIVGGDLFEEFSNSKSDHKIVFARFSPADGAYIIGQQVTGRVQGASGWQTNTVRLKDGGITADETGRVYIWGTAAEGLPLPSHPLFAPNSREHVVDPYYPPGAANAGAFALIVDPSFNDRVLLIRPATQGNTSALGVRRLNGEPFPRIAFGGHVESASLTYTLDAVQGSFAGGATDGFFTVMTGPSGNIPPQAVFELSAHAGKAPLEIIFDASGAVDIDGSILSYEWDFEGDGNWDTSGVSVSYTYTADGSYQPTLRLTDDLGATAVLSKTVVVGNRLPVADFTMNPASGIFPFTVNLDASASADADGPLTHYSWDWNQDGIEDASGVTASFTVSRPGITAVTLEVTDSDGAQASSTLPVTAFTGDTRPVLQDNGRFILEAEAMASLQQRSDSTGQDWVIEDSLSGFVGTGYIHFPGISSIAEPSADAAATQYLLQNNQSATVRLWARVLAIDGASNSFHWSLNGTTFVTGDNNDSSYGFWKWVNLGTSSLGSGVQTLEIRHRESSYHIDRFILSTDLLWVPFGAGPELSPRLGNAPPVAAISASAESGALPFVVSWGGSASSDSDGSIVSWSWDFDGDGLEDATGPNPLHTYTEAGQQIASLLVTDNEGAFGYATYSVEADPNQAPQTDISVDESSGTVPFTVHFNAEGSSDPDGSVVSYAWDFDGDWITDATSPTASFEFLNGGVFEVVLQISDNQGATARQTILINVSNPPTASFTASPLTGDAPLDVNFNASASFDSDGTIVSYAWNFGDGNTASGVTPSHRFLVAGEYTVTLTVTDSAGETDTATQTINVNLAPPVPVIQANLTSGVSPLTVHFDGTGSSGSILGYSWDFGDGNSETGSMVSHTFTGKGVIRVTLTVDDGNFAPQSTTQTIIVSQPPLTILGLLYYEDFEYTVSDVSNITDQVNWSGGRGWNIRSTNRGGGGDAGLPQDYSNGQINISTGTQSLAFMTGRNEAVTDSSLVDQTGTVYVSFIVAKAKNAVADFELMPLKLTASNSTNLAVDLSGEPGNPSSHQWVTASTDGHANYVGLDRGPNSSYEGADLFVVVKFSKDGSVNYNRVDLWVNPSTSDESTGYVGYITGDSGASVFEGITLRSDNMETSYIDEIRIATTFAAAVAAVQSEPFPGPINFSFGQSLVLFELQSSVGFTYQIQTGQTLGDGNWSDVGDSIIGNGGLIQLSIPTPVLDENPVFYRLEALSN